MNILAQKKFEFGYSTVTLSLDIWTGEKRLIVEVCECCDERTKAELTLDEAVRLADELYRMAGKQMSKDQEGKAA